MFKLPDCITTYFQAGNRQDTDTAAASFAPNAFVHDEGQEYRGSVAIREWTESTTQCKAWTEITDSTPRGDDIVVTGQVSGNFPEAQSHCTFIFTCQKER